VTPMATNGIDWETKFGTPFSELPLDGKLTTMYAAIGEIYKGQKEISKQNECLETQQKCLDKHQTYFKLIFAIVALIIVPVVLMACRVWFGL
jgi:hypothetical protein